MHISFPFEQRKKEKNISFTYKHNHKMLMKWQEQVVVVYPSLIIIPLFSELLRQRLLLIKLPAAGKQVDPE